MQNAIRTSDAWKVVAGLAITAILASVNLWWWHDRRPRLLVVEETVNFGVIYHGEWCSRRVKIRNTSKVDIDIDYVQMSCHCGEAVIFESSIPPGESTDLVVNIIGQGTGKQVETELMFLANHDLRHKHTVTIRYFDSDAVNWNVPKNDFVLKRSELPRNIAIQMEFDSESSLRKFPDFRLEATQPYVSLHSHRNSEGHRIAIECTVNDDVPSGIVDIPITLATTDSRHKFTSIVRIMVESQLFREPIPIRIGPILSDEDSVSELLRLETRQRDLSNTVTTVELSKEVAGLVIAEVVEQNFESVVVKITLSRARLLRERPKFETTGAIYATTRSSTGLRETISVPIVIKSRQYDRAIGTVPSRT